MGGLGSEALPEKNSNPQIICYDPRLHDPTFEGGGILRHFFQSPTLKGGVSLRGGVFLGLRRDGWKMTYFGTFRLFTRAFSLIDT